MDLKKYHKDKIIKEIFSCYQFCWSVLIYDNISSEILNNLFKKSDLIDYGITCIYSIGEKREKWDLPAIYLVNCTKEISKTINEDFKSKKYMDYKVFTMCKPEGLTNLIKCVCVDINIKIIEERIFKCDVENLKSLAYILDSKFIISFADCAKNLAMEINEKITYEENKDLKNVYFLTIDRSFDIYTPLMHFLTFRTVLDELERLDLKDNFFPEVKNLYLGDVGDYLKFTAGKLSENFNKLKSDKLDVDALGSLVIEAPKNLELKKNVEKYAGYLNRCLELFNITKNIILLEQNIVLGEDQSGNKKQITLDSCLSIILSPNVAMTDKLGIIFLLKAKGVVFTESEKMMLIAKGFSKTDLEIKFCRKNQILRHKNKNNTNSIVRYKPVLYNIVERFATKKEVFQTLNITDVQIDSLRRSSMFNSTQAPKKTIVVYVKNGLTLEEIALAYELTETLGYEFIFGSDKILSRKEFIEEFKTNKNLHETTSIN